MTDNRTTELRKLLDEYGVEWTNPKSATEFIQTTFLCNGWGIDVLERGIGLCVTATNIFDIPEQVIAALDTRTERTCRNENGNDKYANFICSECGLHMHKPNFGRSYVDEKGTRWYSTSNEHGLHYCPNCGAKVISNEQ